MANYYEIRIKDQNGDRALPDYEDIIIAKNKKEASLKFWEKLPEIYDHENDEIYSAKDDWNPKDLERFIRTVNRTIKKLVKKSVKKNKK